MNPQNSAEALARLQSTQGGQRSLADITAEANQQYGVDKAQEQVTGLRGAIRGTSNLLKQVAPSIMGRTGGSLVTSAQAAKQIQNESAPLQQTLSEQSQDYSLASGDLDKAVQNAQQLAGSRYGDQQNNISYLQNLYNTMFQREEADKAAKAAELARQEQIRQFNAQLQASNAASNRTFDYQVGQDSANRADKEKAAAAQATADNKARAVKDVKSVIGKSNMPAYIKAISSSAARGNALDKIKLELIKQLDPKSYNRYLQSNVNVGTF